MRYLSTRGATPPMPFKDAVLTGLAPDGGLLLPQTIPDVRDRLAAWRGLDFVALAKEVVALFADDIGRDDLDRLIDEAYATFAVPEVVRMVDVGGVHVLELFHGPTLAFKDVALQLLGRLFGHVLGERGSALNIVGATSGDTGSAAIAGVHGERGITIFVMYPHGRVSRLQELQMTTWSDANVHCLAVEGSFDDCQALLKDLFGDLAFKDRMHLGAVNSVNWARVLAQIVYYGYASLAFDQPVRFCVPTGNFGNVFAGYLARRMGFPIEKLIVATNENDILATFFNTGVYERGDVHFTATPAMDIQVASNFERFLYYHLGEDPARVTDFMNEFRATGRASVGAPPQDPALLATSVATNDVLGAIGRVFRATGYVADPHTAVGLVAAERFTNGGPVVCIATAHPAKFPESVCSATGERKVAHPALDALAGRPERRTVIPASLDAVKAFIEAHTSSG
jgi:threonine synthase